MEFEIISKQDVIPEFDSQTIAVKYISYDSDYEEDEITEELISKILQQIPSEIEVILSLDPNGEDNWMEVLCDGKWLALGFSGEFGQDNYYSYNKDFEGSEELSPLRSGGQSPIEKHLTVQDIQTGIKAVEYFIRTGQFYPGIDWAHQL